MFMGPASASLFRSPLRASFLRGWICESTTNPPFIFDGKQTTHFRPRCCGTNSPGSQHFASQSPNTKIFVPSVNFCSTCGGTIERRVPKGEHELRAVCTLCGCVHYQNPKMIVGCLVEDERKVLLCKRSIQPSYGLWTLPAGYMELGESAAEGAMRETREEAQADVEPVSLFAHLDIPRIGQSYIIFRARFKNRHFAPGSESLECRLFDLDEIPFNKIAFSSVNVALQMYLDDYRSGRFKVHHAVIDKRLGAGPSDCEGFVLRDHLSH